MLQWAHLVSWPRCFFPFSATQFKSVLITVPPSGQGTFCHYQLSAWSVRPLFPFSLDVQATDAGVAAEECSGDDFKKFIRISKIHFEFWILTEYKGEMLKWTASLKGSQWILLPRILIIHLFLSFGKYPTNWYLYESSTDISPHHRNCSILHPLPITWFMFHFAAAQHSDFHDVIGSQISLSYYACVWVVLAWRLVSFQHLESFCFLASLGSATSASKPLFSFCFCCKIKTIWL